jgi:hypothetical protein
MKDENLLIANVELFIGSRHVDFDLRVRAEGVPPERLKLQEILRASRHFGGVVAASFRSGRRKFALSLRIGQHSNTQKLPLRGI